MYTECREETGQVIWSMSIRISQIVWSHKHPYL
jgi:hypothetical protein